MGATSSPPRLRRQPEVRAALERMWPVLSGAELVHDLFGFEALIRSAADGVLTAREQRLLLRDRGRPTSPTSRGPTPTSPLVDEADALLGPAQRGAARAASSAPARRATLEGARRTVEELGVGGSTSAGRGARRATAATRSTVGRGDDEPRTFGHVLVDEAQDLTAMQWRMLARRCPSGSMTLVGDFGQASRPGALGQLGRGASRTCPCGVPPRRVTLTVNYRTPAEIMDVANRLLPAAAPGVEPARPVRSTGAHPEFVDRRARASCVRGGRRRGAPARRTRAAPSRSIAPLELHGALAAALADRGAVADSVEAIDAPIAVLSRSTQGPRVRPRRSWSSRARSSRPTARGCGSSTWCSPGRPAASRGARRAAARGARDGSAAP